MAGYSGTSLAKKIGIKEGSRVALVNAPKDFQFEPKELPDTVVFTKPTSTSLDIILFFVTTERALVKDFSKLAARLTANGMIWIAWPKKNSGVATDLSFDRVQRIGLDAGLVDVKICAVDDTWSGLKFVYRLKDRPTLKKR
ncbi:MAG TPA: hypothetical protein VGD61_06300 [Pyrinomonadaceae bacterium]